MLLHHKISDFLLHLFPQINNLSSEELVSFFKKYYTVHGIEPEVRVEEEYVTIRISEDKLSGLERLFNKAVGLCEKNRFDEAKAILIDITAQNPNYSEYYRLLGQIESIQENSDAAIDYLIDSLRRDSTNANALLMMGNVFAKQKNDIETALVYYNQALESKPDDYVSLTNIGYLLFTKEKYSEAEKYLNKALISNSEYSNTWLTLAFVAKEKQDLFGAFKYAIEAMKSSKSKNEVYHKAYSFAIESATNYISEFDGDDLIKVYSGYLEHLGGIKINSVPDDSIRTAAKIEFAENYDRDFHLVKYKATLPAYQHLIMHELTHLEFVIQARNAKVNQLFLANGSNRSNFERAFDKELNQMAKSGYSKEQVELFVNSLFDGLNLQVYNTPIDLFIENKLYLEVHKLQPFQFISLINLIKDGIAASTNELIQKVAPQRVISASKVLNLVNSIQFKELYGYDFTTHFKASKVELDEAKQFYDEFLEYRDDKEPGEEYELIIHWAEDLKLEQFSELVSEIEYRKTRNSVDAFLKAAEDNNLFSEEDDLFKVRLHQKFIKHSEAKGADMAVVMYMFEALKFFGGMETEHVKKIAFEIAMLGTEGIRPEKDGYKVRSIPNKTFKGLQMLAYYYVSWSVAMPEMVSQLEMPYEKEYQLARTLF